MINLKTEVIQALEANQTLTSLLGGTKIYNVAAPTGETYPYITFFEITNFDTEYADNQAYVSEIHFQIDIWSQESTTRIAQEVDKSMKSIDFGRTSSSDLYEKDTKVHHKAMRYKTKRLI